MNSWIDPRTGMGHPEAWVGGNSLFSIQRPITAHDRIIYEIHDEVIISLY